MRVDVPIAVRMGCKQGRKPKLALNAGPDPGPGKQCPGLLPALRCSEGGRPSKLAGTPLTHIREGSDDEPWQKEQQDT